MRPPRLYRIAALVAALVLASGGGAFGHEIPTDVNVQVLAKANGDRLRMVVRVPLRAMRDINFPTQGPGYLVLPDAQPFVRSAAMLWLAPNIELYEDGQAIPARDPIATRISLPSDGSFRSYDDAVAHVVGPPLSRSERLSWDAAVLDALFEYPINSDRSRFSVRLDLARLAVRVSMTLRFVLPDGTIRAFEYRGDPGLIHLDPRWHQAAASFVWLGFRHILDGIDHILFLLCLVIPFRRPRALILIVTSFTVAHSVTLIASAFDLAPGALWFPPLVETLIAMSIAFMALENIVGVSSIRRRWILTFAFGLVHGFGFSFALRESLQFAGSHLLTSLLSFNLGVEIGQLVVLAVLLPSLHVVFRYVMPERIATIVISALVGHTAWHWMTARWQVLSAYAWPTMNPSSMAVVLRWLMAVVLVGAVVWGVSAALRMLPRRTAERDREATPRRSP